MMELEKIRHLDKIVITPSNNSDIALFRHCANGRAEVITVEFNKYVKPMLLIHGVSYIKLTDKTKRQ